MATSAAGAGMKMARQMCLLACIAQWLQEFFYSCGLRMDGTVQCWGDNRSGQTNAPDGAFTSLSAGSIHACGVKANDTLSCWGYSQEYN